MKYALSTSLVQWTSAGLLALSTNSAFAQAQGLLDNAVVIDASAFVISTSVKGNLNGQSVRNPEINFSEVFGTTGRDASPRIDALWRINPHHHLRFTTFEHGRSGSKVLDRDIQWGDYTFKANAKIASELKVQVYELAYEYAFLRRRDYELSASVGVHDQRLSARVSGNATKAATDGGMATLQTQSNSVSAPLPTIGLRAGWVVSPQWYLEGRLQTFGLRVNDTRGHWTEMRLGATWMFHPAFGMGLGYNRFNTQLELSKTRFDGNLKFGYQGIQAYLTGTF